MSTKSLNKYMNETAAMQYVVSVTQSKVNVYIVQVLLSISHEATYWNTYSMCKCRVKLIDNLTQKAKLSRQIVANKYWLRNKGMF